jgi:hypothetical protein
MDLSFVINAFQRGAPATGAATAVAKKLTANTAKTA